MLTTRIRARPVELVDIRRTVAHSLPISFFVLFVLFVFFFPRIRYQYGVDWFVWEERELTESSVGFCLAEGIPVLTSPLTCLPRTPSLHQAKINRGQLPGVDPLRAETRS